MRPAVVTAFPKFTIPKEGRVPFLYLDYADPPGPYVTIAVGNLVDPISTALDLPLMRPDGRPASRAEIAAAWERVKARTDLAPHGGWAFHNVTDLRLTEEGLDRVVMQKLLSVDAQLAAKFPDWEDWCCDAQLFGLSWAWAVGANAKYPKMIAALRAGDFETAAYECTITPNRGSIVHRNEANRILLRNAARVVGMHLDPDRLFFPTDLAAIEQDNIPTRPELPNPPSSAEPVLEDDGGAARREATFWAVDELAKRRDDGEGS